MLSLYLTFLFTKKYLRKLKYFFKIRGKKKKIENISNEGNKWRRKKNNINKKKYNKKEKEIKKKK